MNEIRQPDDAIAFAQRSTVRDGYGHPVVKEWTGKMQYRLDRATEAVIGTRVLALRGDQLVPTDHVRRGEVVIVDKRGRASALAASGQFAHVAWSTPLGAEPNTNEEEE